jgi:hypothetical protein
MLTLRHTGQLHLEHEVAVLRGDRLAGPDGSVGGG